MAREFEDYEPTDQLIGYTVEIVAATLGHNNVALADVPNFIQQVHGALTSLNQPAEPEEPAAVPIIDPRKSVKPDHIVCLECGKKVKIMKSHLRIQHGLTPDQYREKYGLPASYPMIPKAQRELFQARAQNMQLGEKMRAARNAERKKQGKPPLQAVGGMKHGK